MYESGRGVAQNYVTAAEWYRKAGEHVPDLGGAGQGRNNLGLLYLDGLGVPKDYVQAYYVARPGERENSTIVEAKMTPAQVSEAQRMVEERKKLHPMP